MQPSSPPRRRRTEPVRSEHDSYVLQSTVPTVEESAAAAATLAESIVPYVEPYLKARRQSQPADHVAFAQDRLV